MDQALRNQLQRTTQAARMLLERECTAQLEGTYDILPDGTIAKKPGLHLDAGGRLVRQKLVEAVQHRIAGGQKAADAVADYSREAAFTCLNRFVALKMLEARGLVQTCVSKGEQSGGFREFCGLAPGLSDLPDGGYQLYLESLCDELSVEVKVLFDRRDPASLLWPHRQALTDLLALLNDTELASVWIEDETIGWVYQYFNSKEERQAMRDPKQGGSQAPRNSRELAVRNQFFTPRYVVEFLTDNTLGRIWYEMTKGQTILKDSCRYLVRRPNEIFLSEGQAVSEREEPVEDLSQEELLKQPCHVPHRPLKDPRDIKMLDPACGSMHFGLYAFDLFERIYDEAWEIEATLGEDAFVRSEGLESLHKTYGSKEAFLRDVPRLIIERNIHGIDIDPRCAQIAAFSLWMRAQRAYNELGLERSKRPPIRKTNIVVAEPMPGETDLLREFTSTLQPKLLGQLVAVVFDKMKMAGEAGSLLKIEEELADAISAARKLWVIEPKARQQRLFVEEDEEIAEQREFDLSGVTDETFWHEAENLVLGAMQQYARGAENGLGFRRQLFAEDATCGFAFIDLCRQRYDVVLMNPPFGETTPLTAEYIALHYPNGATDLACAFTIRWCQSQPSSARLGAIMTRNPTILPTTEAWRQQLSGQAYDLDLLADLGYGVLDAKVETVALLLVRTSETIRSTTARFFPLIGVDEKWTALRRAVDAPSPNNSICAYTDTFKRIPGGPWAYWCPDRVRDMYAGLPPFQESNREVRQGIATGDDFRFLRLSWETPPSESARTGHDIESGKRWIPIAKGGEYCPYSSELPLSLNWRKNGAEVRNFYLPNGKLASRPQNTQYFFRPGITFIRRTSIRLCAYVFPKGSAFSDAGPTAFFDGDSSAPLAALAFFNSLAAEALMSPHHARGMEGDDQTKRYDTGLIQRLPWPDLSASPEVGELASQVLANLKRYDRTSEPSRVFTSHELAYPFCVDAAYEQLPVDAILRLQDVIFSTLGLSLCEVATGLDSEWKMAAGSPSEARSRVIAELGVSRPRRTARDKVQLSISYAIGTAFGRWDIRFATGEKRVPEILDPFVPLPVCPPGQLQNEQGLPITEEEVGSLREEGRWDYPIEIPWNGVLTDDLGHPLDLEARVRQVLRFIWKDRWEAIEREALDILDVRDLRDYFRKNNGFFDDHIKRYSDSRRKAPIYWELATPSHGYAVWLYYHRFTRDTFYKILNDYVKPKLTHEEQKLARVRAEAGENPSRAQTKELEAQGDFVAELATFREEIERIAPLWSPNLNDGVVINFGPLWRLLPQHKSWQKECKECWDSLVIGDYEWAHLAMYLWPERVVPKCHEDRSLAFAHGLENLLWVEDYDKWRALNEQVDEIEDQKKRRRRKQHDRLRDDFAAMAQVDAAKLTAAELWRKLELGDLDDTDVALLLWPARVVEKCVEDPRLASKLRINVPERRTKPAIEKLIKKHEDNGCGKLAVAVGAVLAARDTPYPKVWKSLETGDLDDQALALALWPDRVVDKCVVDVGLAQKHDLARFFWYDDPWSKTWRRRESPDIEVKNEVAHRHQPAVKAALESLLSAPTPGAGTKRQRKK